MESVWPGTNEIPYIENPCDLLRLGVGVSPAKRKDIGRITEGQRKDNMTLGKIHSEPLVQIPA